MYSLVSAIAKSLSGSKRWTSVDISNVPIDTLYNQYSRVIATLTNPFLPSQVALDLASIRSGIAGETVTFTQYLQSLGNTSLPTFTPVPTINTQYAQYADGFQAGYSFTPVLRSAAVDAVLPPSAKHDVYMTKPGMDYELFYKNCLVNVNGYFHMTDTDGTGIYVMGANRTRWLSKRNQVGILSFLNLGNIQLIPITPQMVTKQNSRQTLYNHAYINLGVDLTNSTVMMVIGGYLHILDQHSFYQVNPTTVAFMLSNTPFMDRFYESKGSIDLSGLPLTKNPNNPGHISLAEFYSDANVLAYLTLSQSFAVVLSNNEVFVEREPLHNSVVPGAYTCYDEVPVYPLITGVGKLGNYWPVYEDTQWSLHCLDTWRAKPLYKTVDPANLITATGACEPFRPFIKSPGCFLKIGADYSNNTLL